jgi:hypothetical protein
MDTSSSTPELFSGSALPALKSLSLLPVPSLDLQMPPPPEAIYSSQDELYRSIQAWAAQHNYAFRIGRSKVVGSSSRKKILYDCDRSGKPPPVDHASNYPHTRKRQTKTRKTGCQFSINAIELNNSQWEVRTRLGAQYNTHNHSPSHAASSHPAHRKLTHENINQVQQLHSAGTYLYSVFIG